jgi:hypothetical protein
MIENTSSLEIRQLGDFTEIHWKRTIGSKVTSCQSCIDNNPVNCTTSEAVTQSRKVSQILDQFSSNVARKTSTSRSKDKVSFCVAKETPPGDEPLLFETYVQTCASRRRGTYHDSQSIPCNSVSGSTSYEFVSWNIKLRERCYPHTLIPLSSLPQEESSTRKKFLMTFVDIHKVLAMSFPDIQQATEVVPFLESKGIRMSNTRLALHPGKEFSDVVTRPSVIKNVATAIKERPGVPTALRLDKDDRPFDDRLPEYISPWYKELEDLYCSNFRFAEA